MVIAPYSCFSGVFKPRWQTWMTTNQGMFFLYLALIVWERVQPRWCSSKEFACQWERGKRCEFCPWVGKIPWSRKWQPLQYSCPKNPMDRGAWQATIHGVAKSQTQLSTAQLTAWGTITPHQCPMQWAGTNKNHLSTNHWFVFSCVL